MRRVPVAVAVVLLCLLQAPAQADDEGGGPTAGAYVDDGGSPTAVAEDTATRPAFQTAADRPNCLWRRRVDDDWKIPVYGFDGTRQFSETGQWRQMVCDGELVYVDGWPLVPVGERVDVGALAARAERALAVPDPELRTSPPADRLLFVRVPTWLWVDGWRQVSATASAGRVTATVTARPVRSLWSMGDGGSVTCAGAGVPWRRGLPESASSCRYSYERSSAGEPQGSFVLSTTVEFEVGWSSNVGMSGVLSNVSRSASRPVRVGEIQAVESR